MTLRSNRQLDYSTKTTDFKTNDARHQFTGYLGFSYGIAAV
jgi:hypothetical protein